MKILFDQGTPVPLRRFLTEHSISTAYKMQWSNLSNDDLLVAAEGAGFDMLITTDQNLQHQQNLSNRKITIVVLLSTSWPQIQSRIDKIQEAINAVNPGGYVEISI